jgi:hypothetical protein
VLVKNRPPLSSRITHSNPNRNIVNSRFFVCVCGNVAMSVLVPTTNLAPRKECLEAADLVILLQFVKLHPAPSRVKKFLENSEYYGGRSCIPSTEKGAEL